MDQINTAGVKALSIRQPWAWFIVKGFKDIENRTWPTKVRGTILVHASKPMTRAEWEDAIRFAHRRCGVSKGDLQNGCEFDQLLRGGVVGSVEIAGCVSSSTSNWFVGAHGFLLRGATVRSFEPMRGRLGFFDVSADLATSTTG